ncbi:MAG TPA: thioredoxin domain-containing protein, partial [Candidatus Goldiibacteriota bacterium]|nr:thioredoxin domain-containing protein [Candidatus Goldiibacteriota bacterium]
MEKNINDQSFKKEVLESNLPVLVDFWAPWCLPCLMISGTVSKIASEQEEKLKVCKVNVDEAPDLSQKYGIS